MIFQLDYKRYGFTRGTDLLEVQINLIEIERQNEHPLTRLKDGYFPILSKIPRYKNYVKTLGLRPRDFNIVFIPLYIPIKLE